MSDQKPYLERNPGDLITAEDWNSLQNQIQHDITSQVEEAKTEIREGTVKQAENAQKFEKQSGDQWKETLDGRYASLHHEHEGQSVYRRYIKEFTAKINMVCLEHGLGRYPLVDTYQLLPVVTGGDLDGCKILVYYGHADAEKYKLFMKVWRDDYLLGYPLEQLLIELGVPYHDEQILEDVINDLWDAFHKDPNDKIKHCVTPWIEEKCNKKRTVADLKKAGQWEDLRVALKPQKCGFGTNSETNLCVNITQVDYKTLYIEVPDSYFANNEKTPLCLMFLLRI